MRTVTMELSGVFSNCRGLNYRNTLTYIQIMHGVGYGYIIRRCGLIWYFFPTQIMFCP